jgi:hypothetical protein
MSIILFWLMRGLTALSCTHFSVSIFGEFALLNQHILCYVDYIPLLDNIIKLIYMFCVYLSIEGLAYQLSLLSATMVFFPSLKLVYNLVKQLAKFIYIYLANCKIYYRSFKLPILLSSFESYFIQQYSTAIIPFE